MSFCSRFGFVTSLVLCSLSAIACSDAPADSGLEESPPPAEPAGKTACNTLANVAADVPIMAVASAPPAAAGGAIADGTYVVESATLYTGPGGTSGPTGKNVRMTVAIDGDHAATIFDGVARSATFHADGTHIHTTTTCPSTATEDTAFTATPTTLLIYLIDSKGTRVYSLAKSVK